MGPIATAQNGNGHRRRAPLARRARHWNSFQNCLVLLSVTSWLFLLLLAGANLPRTTATEVKWTASTTTAAALDANGQRLKETAATAPRSQKYWDEHNIERPDYAKTDAELAHEKYERRKGDQSTTNGGSHKNNKIKQVFLLLLMVGALGYFVPRVVQQQYFPGSRLGSASGGGGGDRGSLFPSWLLVPIQQQLLQWQQFFFENHPPTTPEEKARAARLSRFEAPDLSRFEAKDD
jgi:hypothetical protein